MDVSVVIPVKNGCPFLSECLDSLLCQDFTGKWEVCIYDDCSTDATPSVIEHYSKLFGAKGIGFSTARGLQCGGVGASKNGAVALSQGRFLCFSDSDDISFPNRIRVQFDLALKIAKDSELLLIGSQFVRTPEDSTVRYTRWSNDLPIGKLSVQIFTSHGPTIIAPTWFMSRRLFSAVGGFDDCWKSGYPEDLKFFYSALDADARIDRANQSLVAYRYHQSCASFSVLEETIWDLRISHLRKHVLGAWKEFTIWSLGKQGKRFFKCLSELEKSRVRAFCDVDQKKIARGVFEAFDDSTRSVTHRIPIVSVREAVPPVIVCVKLDMTNGDLERLLELSGWIEGLDFVLFS